MDQLTEQLAKARADLQQARAERAHFEAMLSVYQADMTTMRKEFEEALAELTQLRLFMFEKWERSATDRIN